MEEQFTEPISGYKENHKAGFVSIVGKPNVGKSTLMNRIIGEKLSIITSKAQTTRHRIMGIWNTPDFQIVYSDTPGIISPKYALHDSMMGFVKSSLEDADLILFVTDIFEKHDENEALSILEHVTVPIVVIINKIDLATQNVVEEKMNYWKEKISPMAIIPISALNDFNILSVETAILESMPVHPPFFPKDEVTDKPQRFFAAEMIREKIFNHFDKEVPYACEVVISDFKEFDDIIKIRAEIMVEREGQKGILIGKGGGMLKIIGREARIDMEKFFGKKVFLEQYVKIEANWRKKQRSLNKFGYR